MRERIFEAKWRFLEVLLMIYRYSTVAVFRFLRSHRIVASTQEKWRSHLLLRGSWSRCASWATWRRSWRPRAGGQDDVEGRRKRKGSWTWRRTSWRPSSRSSLRWRRLESLQKQHTKVTGLPCLPAHRHHASPGQTMSTSHAPSMHLTPRSSSTAPSPTLGSAERPSASKAILTNTLYLDMHQTKEAMTTRMAKRIRGAGVPTNGYLDWEFDDGRGIRCNDMR